MASCGAIDWIDGVSGERVAVWKVLEGREGGTYALKGSEGVWRGLGARGSGLGARAKLCATRGPDSAASSPRLPGKGGL